MTAPCLGLPVPAPELPGEVRDDLLVLSELPEGILRPPTSASSNSTLDACVSGGCCLFGCQSSSSPAPDTSIWVAQLPCNDLEGPDDSLKASRFRPASLQASRLRNQWPPVPPKDVHPAVRWISRTTGEDYRAVCPTPIL